MPRGVGIHRHSTEPFLDAQIDAGGIEYGQAKAYLDDCLALAGGCHAIYMSIDDSLRRLANQAVFHRLTAAADDTVNAEPGEPFNILFDPNVQRAALARQHATTESGPQTGNVVGLIDDVLVGLTGLEPVTSALSGRRSNRLSYRPGWDAPRRNVTAPDGQVST